MADEGGADGFRTESMSFVVPDPPAPRKGRVWVPLVLGGLALLVLGVLIGLAIDRDEPDRELAARSADSTTSTTPSTAIAPDTVPTTERANATASTRAAGSAGRPPTTVRRATTPTTTTRSTTSARPSDRVVGRAAGGGSGNGATTISFEVSGKWRIDHVVKGAEATITVIDRAAGYSVSYTASVGSGSRVFDRTCGCRVVVSSPEGTYDVTVVDTAG